MQEPLFQPVAEIYSERTRAAAGSTSGGAHDAWVLGLSLSGSAWLNDGSAERFQLKPGTCVLIRPRVMNRWHVPPTHGWRCISIFFLPRPHWQQLLNYPQDPAGYSVIRFKQAAAARRVRRLLQRVHRYAVDVSPLGTQFAMNALERALLLCWQGQEEPPSKLDPRIKKALDTLSARWREPCKLETLARECHLSRSHFASLFKAQVGDSPIQFHERQRLVRASEMLRLTYYSVQQVAERAGFEDPRYFCKRFKKMFGVAPRGFRTMKK